MAGGAEALRQAQGALTAVVVSSELPRIGEFECSDELLNQLHRNVVWGTRGNFLDVPTDCPQRDERLGWTGDIAVFAPTAAYLFDVEDFLRDWLADLAAEQRAANGMVSFVVPDVLKYVDKPSYFPAPESTAIWSDAAVWVPWALWQAYGDLEVLSDQFDSMTAHVRRVNHCSRPPDCGTPGSNSEIGWIRPHLPTIRSAAKRTTASWRLPASTATSEFLPRPPACLDAAGMPRISHSSPSAQKLPSTTIT